MLRQETEWRGIASVHRSGSAGGLELYVKHIWETLQNSRDMGRLGFELRDESYYPSHAERFVDQAEENPDKDDEPGEVTENEEDDHK